MLRNAFKPFKAILDHVMKVRQPLSHLILRNVKNGLFRQVKEFIRLLPILEAGFGDDGALVDQLSTYRQISYDFSMIKDPC